MTLSDLSDLAKIFRDTERCTVYLRQLSFFLLVVSVMCFVSPYLITYLVCNIYRESEKNWTVSHVSVILVNTARFDNFCLQH